MLHFARGYCQAVGIIRVVLPHPAHTTVSSWPLANYGSRLSSFLTEKCKKAAVGDQGNPRDVV
jgi:hypothetical protein